jgi:RNA recognition motif-containing protein
MARLFIGNLPYKANEEEIAAMFADAGVTVDNVQVMRDKFSGQSRGFGFADVDQGSVQRAVDGCNGRALMGRNIIVNEARPQEERGGGGGGRGGRGGGGYNR